MVESYVDARSSTPNAVKREWSHSADVRRSVLNTSASKERQILRNDDVKSGGAAVVGEDQLTSSGDGGQRCRCRCRRC